MAIDRYQCGDTRWRTPLDLAQDVRGVLGGIVLDPCTEPGNHLRATRFYTIENDGLSRPWEDGTWCNPPYGPGLEDWLLKAVREAQNGYRIGVLTSVSRTETAYFQEFANQASCTQWMRGKLKHSEGKPAMLASWIFWFNVSPDVVDREMGWRGIITAPWR